MELIKSVVVYLLFFIFNVKTIVNETEERLEKCVANIGDSVIDTNESAENILKLIEQSTVILKAFCSENLISFVDDSDELLNEDVKDSVDDKNYYNDVEDDDYYNDYYIYKSDDEKKRKTLLTFTPHTIYKGTSILRQLESFNNQEYFVIKGQLNATLELEKQQKILYKRKCFNNHNINMQGQPMNDNHLIEKQLRHLVPGQLIIFGKLDKYKAKSKNHLMVKTNGIIQWTSSVETFLWNHLGWSNWSEWSHCSSSCKGIQQRHRHCLSTQHNRTNQIAKMRFRKSTARAEPNQMDKTKSAIITNVPKQHQQQLCDGYNIEQRDCNLFECIDAINVLPFLNNSIENNFKINSRISQFADRKDFTIMLTIRAKVSREQLFANSTDNNQHLFSLHSNINKETSLTISLIESGLKITQEKESTSEMFNIKLKLFDLHWHQIAISIRRDGFITCYVDCTWDSSLVLTKGAFVLPKLQPSIEINSKLNGLFEWKQLSLIAGNHEREQCSNERKPIFDNNKFLEKIFNDERN
ncbi:unnamed protein product [Diamesa hyperborea]